MRALIILILLFSSCQNKRPTVQQEEALAKYAVPGLVIGPNDTAKFLLNMGFTTISQLSRKTDARNLVVQDSAIKVIQKLVVRDSLRNLLLTQFVRADSLRISQLQKENIDQAATIQKITTDQAATVAKMNILQLLVNTSNSNTTSALSQNSSSINALSATVTALSNTVTDLSIRHDTLQNKHTRLTAKTDTKADATALNAVIAKQNVMEKKLDSLPYVLVDTLIENSIVPLGGNQYRIKRKD